MGVPQMGMDEPVMSLMLARVWVWARVWVGGTALGPLVHAAAWVHLGMVLVAVIVGVVAAAAAVVVVATVARVVVVVVVTETLLLHLVAVATEMLLLHLVVAMAVVSMEVPAVLASRASTVAMARLGPPRLAMGLRALPFSCPPTLSTPCCVKPCQRWWRWWWRWNQWDGF